MLLTIFTLEDAFVLLGDLGLGADSRSAPLGGFAGAGRPCLKGV